MTSREYINKIGNMDRQDFRAQQLIPAAVAVIIPVVLAIVFLLFCGVKSCHAEDINIKVIAELESSGNVFAKNGEHYGLCQLSRLVLADYNRTYHTIWQTVDLYNGVLNMRIAEWYANKEIPRLLKHYKLADTLENRITAWRLGIKAVMLKKQATKYIQAYRRNVNVK
jgi:hypothetical protein